MSWRLSCFSTSNRRHGWSKGKKKEPESRSQNPGARIQEPESRSQKNSDVASFRQIILVTIPPIKAPVNGIWPDFRYAADALPSSAHPIINGNAVPLFVNVNVHVHGLAFRLKILEPKASTSFWLLAPEFCLLDSGSWILDSAFILPLFCLYSCFFFPIFVSSTIFPHM